MNFEPVPIEIDTHYKLYGKYMWDVVYNDGDGLCSICEKRIDEFGLCACGACGG